MGQLSAGGRLQEVRYANGHTEDLEDAEVLQALVVRQRGCVTFKVAPTYDDAGAGGRNVSDHEDCQHLILVQASL